MSNNFILTFNLRDSNSVKKTFISVPKALSYSLTLVAVIIELGCVCIF